MSAATTLCFVGASDGNHFMNELLSAVAHTVRAEGVDASVVMDTFSPAEDASVHVDDSTVYVVIPHEYFLLAPPAGHPTRGQLARTISLCVEQPGTTWFELSRRHAARTAAAMDIQRSSVGVLRRLGLAAEHFRLGYTDGRGLGPVAAPVECRPRVRHAAARSRALSAPPRRAVG